jgi:site-specific recombinase XerD
MDGLEGEGKIDQYSPTLNQALSYMKSLKDQGLSYSALNTARSALSTVISIPGCQTFGTHPLVSRFMKGVYEELKPQPKYTHIWDVSTVLSYLATLKLNSSLSLKNLTRKLVMLLLLVSGQRGQTIHSLTLQGMALSDSSCQFQVLEHLKTSKPGGSPTVIRFQKYDQDANICPLLTLAEYLKRTKSLRGDEDQLFISYLKPYKAVSHDTISRWVKQALADAGINTNIYTPHSTRAASTSKIW